VFPFPYFFPGWHAKEAISDFNLSFFIILNTIEASQQRSARQASLKRLNSVEE